MLIVIIKYCVKVRKCECAPSVWFIKHGMAHFASINNTLSWATRGSVHAWDLDDYIMKSSADQVGNICSSWESDARPKSPLITDESMVWWRVN